MSPRFQITSMADSEAITFQKLVKGHAYSVTGAEEVTPAGGFHGSFSAWDCRVGPPSSHSCFYRGPTFLTFGRTHWAVLSGSFRSFGSAGACRPLVAAASSAGHSVLSFGTALLLWASYK